jgi:hypothetical protein
MHPMPLRILAIVALVLALAAAAPAATVLAGSQGGGPSCTARDNLDGTWRIEFSNGAVLQRVPTKSAIQIINQFQCGT